MSTKASYLMIGLTEFAEPTLLLLGDAATFRWLADQIAVRKVVDLAQAPMVQLNGLELSLAPVDVAGRLERKGQKFTWYITRSEAMQFAEQLRELAACTGPSHAYLDSELTGAAVQVVASKGEYSSAAVFNS